MKKTVPCLIVLIFLSVSLARAQNFRGREKQIKIDPPDISLKADECLEYSAEWLGIPAGKIVLKVEGVVNFSGRQCYYLSARLFPNRFFANFYDVDYSAHSYVDTATFQPLHFERRKRINNQVNITTIDFDWVKKKATFTSNGKIINVAIFTLQPPVSQQNPTTNVITAKTQDVLSIFYYFRLHDIEIVKNYRANIYYDHRSWPVSVEIEKPFLKAIRKKGAFPVFTASVSSGITDFIFGRHKFVVCFTADSRRIPLEFDVGTAIGFIRCTLRKLHE